MIASTDHGESHGLAIALVREVARGTGLTTIAKISASDEIVGATTESLLPTNIHQPNHAGLLHTAADLERRFPHPENPVVACAFVLPEQDIVAGNPTRVEGAVSVLITAVAAAVNATVDSHDAAPANRPQHRRAAGLSASVGDERTGSRPRPFPAPTLPAGQPGPADQAPPTVPPTGDASPDRQPARRPR